jgi:hypothetical protein
MIKGTGPKGLTDRHLFLAERVYDDAVGSFAEQQRQQQRQQAAFSDAVGLRGGSSSSSSSSGGIGAARRLGHWQANQQRRKQVLLGDAREGLCFDFLT